jgi:hypothetical protein
MIQVCSHVCVRTAQLYAEGVCEIHFGLNQITPNKTCVTREDTLVRTVHLRVALTSGTTMAIQACSPL